MISITDFFKLIPDSLKQSAVDALVETVVERGEGLLSDSILNKIKGLRSDAAFRKQLDAGLQRGLQRFIDEYQLEDEDLVTAVLQSPALFTNPEIQTALVAIVQQPGHYLVEEQTLIGQSFAAVLPERINRDRVDRAVFHLLKCLAQELWHLPELQPIYSLEFQRITAESTREQLDVQKAQLAALETLNVGVRDALLQLTDALGEQKQLTSGQSRGELPTPRPAVYHNLPQPNYGEFVGREKEIRQIFDLLRPYPQSRHHLIVIDGIGGIGKSALALEVAHRCLRASQSAAQSGQPESDHLARLRQILIERFNEEELHTLCFDLALDYDMLPGKSKGGKARELLAYLSRRNRLSELIDLLRRERPDVRDKDLSVSPSPESALAEQFDAIIWTSAKRTVMTSDGITIRHQNINTLHDIYRAIAVALEREDLLRARPEEQSDIVRQALTRQRTLLVVDNFETIDDERVVTFLQELPAPTKAIVTTRHRINVAYPVRLAGMPWEDAEALIRHECLKKVVQLRREEESHLYDRTGGVPLAIVWSIGQMGFGYAVESVLTRLGHPTSDIARFCFEGAIEQIRGKPAYHLLTTLAIFEVDAARDVLGFVLEMPDLDRDDGLAQLEKLSLANRQNGRFSLLPLTKTFALSEMEQETIYQYRQRAMKWLIRMMEADAQFDWPSFTNTEKERGNILALVIWGFTEGAFEEAALCLRRIDSYMWSRGYWNEQIDYLRVGISAAHQHNSNLYLGEFNFRLGRLLRFQEHLDEALQCTQSALEYFTLVGNEVKSLDVERNLGMILMSQNKITEAREVMLRSLSRVESIRDIHPDCDGFAAHLYNNLAEIELKAKNLDAVQIYIGKSQAIADKREDLEVTRAVIHRLKGKLAFAQGDFDAAETHFKRSLISSQAIHLQQDQAYAVHHLARVAFAQENYDSAISLAEESINLFEHLGMKGHIDKAKRLLDNAITITSTD